MAVALGYHFEPHWGVSVMRTLSFCLIVLSCIAPGAGHAQSAVESRVGRLEGEMRAVQRKIFPGGNGQYVQPDNGPAPTDEQLPGTPASSPVADLTARVDSLEVQLRSLTGQLETTGHRQDLLEGRIKTLEAGASTPPTASDAAPYGAGDANSRSGDDTPLPAPPRKPAPRPLDTTAAPAGAVPTKPASDPARAARIAAIERPDSGDVAEDTYLYGYRLWAADLYPEAEAQFLAVTTKYPTHKRASYAQNLLGRSYLDDGKPSLASLAFLDSYKKWPDGDRAPESLLYLARALVKLDKPPAQVCKVYTELSRSYAAKIEADARMKAAIAKGRAESRCS